MEVLDAIERPFEEYMQWCHEFCRSKASSNQIFQDLYSSAGFATLEIIWARRYWYHHANKVSHNV